MITPFKNSSEEIRLKVIEIETELSLLKAKRDEIDDMLKRINQYVEKDKRILFR